MFKVGDVVKLKATIPQGPVTKMRMDEDGTIWYLMSWPNSDGTNSERWFSEAEIEAAE